MITTGRAATLSTDEASARTELTKVNALARELLERSGELILATFVEDRPANL